MEFLKLWANLRSKLGQNYKSVIFRSVKFYGIGPWLRFSFDQILGNNIEKTIVQFELLYWLAIGSGGDFKNAILCFNQKKENQVTWLGTLWQLNTDISLGCPHSSLDSSVLTILSQRVWVPPSTPSTYAFIIHSQISAIFVPWKEENKQKEDRFGPFKKVTYHKVPDLGTHVLDVASNVTILNQSECIISP